MGAGRISKSNNFVISAKCCVFLGDPLHSGFTIGSVEKSGGSIFNKSRCLIKLTSIMTFCKKMPNLSNMKQTP